jgi:hypothetical protein
MQRARPFRLGIWRLGLLVLAWYALVIQGLLGGAMAARASFDPLAMAGLCADGPTAGHESPSAPLHTAGSCDCIAHCASAGSGAPPRDAMALRAPTFATAAIAVVPGGQFEPILLLAAAPARGPPSIVDFTA